MSGLRLRLSGAQAELGEVPSGDVARLLLLVEKAAARAASVVLGEPKTTAGRYREVIEQAVRFRLRAIEPGSVVPVLELPAPPLAEGGFELPHVTTLGESALGLMLDELEGGRDSHPVVTRALLELADGIHVGERYDALDLSLITHGHVRRRACVDGQVRARLRARVDREPAVAMRSDDVVGVLVEADFEKRTARLRTAIEPAVVVEFDDDLADEIQAALRQQTTLRGEVVFDPKTHTAKAVRLRQMIRGEQLELLSDAFWSETTVGDLERHYGLGPPPPVADLFDAEASDDEREAFMAALAELD